MQIAKQLDDICSYSESICASVIYGVERGQCTFVYHLRIFEKALLSGEKPQVIDGVERGCVCSGLIDEN